MDNLAVHKHKEVLPVYEELDFDVVYNVKYMPDFNPIEVIFAHVKGWYKR